MTNNKKIYILHGWAYSVDKWGPFLGLLEKNGFETIMLQIPGLTASLDEVWDLENYIIWLRETLKKEKEKVILLGHSNGGRIALAFAAQYPERVERLILLDSAGIYHNELSIRMKRILFKSLAKMGKKVTDSHRLRKIFYKFTREQDYEKANPILRETMKNLITADLLPDLEKVSTPTTIIWGALDKTTPVHDAKVMHQHITKSSLHLIDGARHSPQFTHINEVADIILSEIK